MTDFHVTQIAGELGLAAAQVQAVAGLLAEGGTVPFVARYRKEATGSLDEVAITAIRDRLAQLAELDQRRTAILASLEERGLLTDELRARVLAAATLAALEDVYLPFRPKRRTRAMLARERGLEPLAERLWAQDPRTDPEAQAAPFVDPERGVPDVAAALAGARDILAERVNEDADGRAELRTLYRERAVVRSRVVKGREQEGAKYRDYFDATEPATQAPSHRMLALRRGEAEGFLTLELAPPPEPALACLEARFVRGPGAAAEQVRAAVHDSYKRLLGPALETELRLWTKQRADEQAIRVFAANLRQLLLAPPLGRKRVLAVDPGFRTGAKLVCLDPQGQLAAHDVIFPTHGERGAAEAAAVVRTLCQRHAVETIAVGNGTAGRETEAFLRGLELPGAPAVVMVNESGASIYSASEVAREEFPDQDVTVRGAVSIGRRLQDPLAELVKLDPKSIGVGQYQHDVDQGELRRSLDDVVASCVNAVGVEVNTASRQLLAYVSGLGPQLAANVVAWRAEHGPFRSRRQLRDVPRLGPKAFELAAGFLRVRDGEHPLDASAVHPERYALVERIARELGCTTADLLRDEALRRRIDVQRYVGDGIGLPTLLDILAELARPGRDPRERFEPVRFAEGVRELADLQPGMRLAGVVTNVTAFGAFVDVGVHQDGLVHVSRLADRFVRDPAEVVHVGQHVTVTVVEVDLERRRIGLSLREGEGARPAAPRAGRPPARPEPPAPKTRMAELLQDWHAKRSR
jgi:uncharacterized protein